MEMTMAKSALQAFTIVAGLISVPSVIMADELPLNAADSCVQKEARKITDDFVRTLTDTYGNIRGGSYFLSRESMLGMIDRCEKQTGEKAVEATKELPAPGMALEVPIPPSHKAAPRQETPSF